MKKQNFKGKFGKLSNSPKTQKSCTAVSTGDKDTYVFNGEQKSFIRNRYYEVLELNADKSEHDINYITQEDLKNEFNEYFGVNKSIRSYYRIWNESDETDF